MIKRSVLFICALLLLLPSLALAEDLYVASAAAGNGSGSSCSNALAYTFFNNAANWGVGAGKISAGDTVHVCGTITGAAASNLFVFQADGTSGAGVITLKFETDAILQAPYFGSSSDGASTGGAISTNGKSYLVIDGGTNGIIKNTDSGTTRTYKTSMSTGVYINQGSHDVEVARLNILDLYVRTPCTSDAAGETYSVLFQKPGSNIKLHHCTMTESTYAWVGHYGVVGVSNWEIYNNTASRMKIQFALAEIATASLSGLYIHDNELFDNYVWWDRADNNHLNSLVIWANYYVGTTATDIHIYNNYFHGNFGRVTCSEAPDSSHTTDMIQVQRNCESCNLSGYIYNNVLVFDTAQDYGSNGSVYINYVTGPWGIYNNTIIGSSGSGYGIFDQLNSNTTIKNNILKTWDHYINSCTGWGLTSNYNSFSAKYSGGVFGWGADSYTEQSIAMWKALGFDANSSFADPKLNSNFTLQSDSPARSAGTNLTSLGITALNSDKNGVARPSSGAWDIGAYEYGAGGSITGVSAPGGVTIK